MTKYILCLASILILLSACSSLPKQVQPQEKTNADQMLVYAQQLENQHRYSEAKTAFQSARHQYVLLADSEGLLLSLSGLARVSSLLDDAKGVGQYREQMEDLISMIDKSKGYHLLLLDLQVLHQQRDYAKVSELARLRENFPDEARLQVLTYKIQAESYLNKSDPEEARYLTALFNRYAGRLKARKFNSPELVTNAAYALAYHHYSKTEPFMAKKYLRQAKDIDFRYGLFYNYAFDLWLEAKVALLENDRAKSVSSLYSSLLIFQQFNDTAMVEKINQDLAKLGKEELNIEK